MGVPPVAGVAIHCGLTHFPWADLSMADPPMFPLQPQGTPSGEGQNPGPPSVPVLCCPISLDILMGHSCWLSPAAFHMSDHGP